MAVSLIVPFVLPTSNKKQTISCHLCVFLESIYTLALAQALTKIWVTNKCKWKKQFKFQSQIQSHTPKKKCVHVSRISWTFDSIPCHSLAAAPFHILKNEIKVYIYHDYEQWQLVVCISAQGLITATVTWAEQKLIFTSPFVKTPPDFDSLPFKLS